MCIRDSIINSDIHNLRVFERKILRKIFGSMKEDGEWCIRNNRQLEESIDGEDLMRFINSIRISWLGRVMHVEDDRVPKAIVRWTIDGLSLIHI